MATIGTRLTILEKALVDQKALNTKILARLTALEASLKAVKSDTLVATDTKQ